MQLFLFFISMSYLGVPRLEFFPGVNERFLCVAGIVGGDTTDYLIMVDGTNYKKKQATHATLKHQLARRFRPDSRARRASGRQIARPG